MGGELALFLALMAAIVLGGVFIVYYIVRKVLKGPNRLIKEIMEEWFEQEKERTGTGVEPDAPIEPKQEPRLSSVVKEKAEQAKSGMPPQQTRQTAPPAPSAQSPTRSASAAEETPAAQQPPPPAQPEEQQGAAPAPDPAEDRPFLREHSPDDHDKNSQP